MGLEKRVEILEQEVAVLKNQIQSTLLDIKENVLTNTHAELRADVSVGSQDQSAHSEHVSSVAIQTNLNPQTPESNAPFPVRQVSLDTIHDTQLTQPEQIPHEASSAQSEGGRDWSAMAQHEAWLTNKVREIGAHRTRELIQVYGENGHFDGATCDTLLQLVAIYEHDDNNRKQQTLGFTMPNTAPEQVRRANPRPSAAPGTRKQRPERHSEQPQAKQRGKQGRRRKQAQKQQTAPAKKSNPEHVPAKKKLSEDEDTSKGSNLVLRLIAGVQNAGAGMRWNKKNG